jgi:hypothetical protein
VVTSVLAVEILYTTNGKEFFSKDILISLVRDPVELGQDKLNVLKPHWEALRHHLSKESGNDLPVNHVPLYLYMQEKKYKANPVRKETLRLGTFNITSGLKNHVWAFARDLAVLATAVLASGFVRIAKKSKRG